MTVKCADTKWQYTHDINFNNRMTHVADNASRLHSVQFFSSENTFIAYKHIQFALERTTYGKQGSAA